MNQDQSNSSDTYISHITEKGGKKYLLYLNNTNDKEKAIEAIQSQSHTAMHNIESIILFKVVETHNIDPNLFISEATKNELAEYKRLHKKYGDT